MINLNPIKIFFPAIALCIFFTPVQAESLKNYIKENSSNAESYATVNGVPITKAYVEAILKRRGIKNVEMLPQDNFKRLMDELITMEVLIQEAMREDINKRQDVIHDINEYKRNTFAKHLINDYVKAHPVSDKQLKDIYNKSIKTLEPTEYNASHILVKSKEQALAIIVTLNKGKDFAEQAKLHSIDSSKSEGGNLGWFSARTMVKPFSAAVMGLKKGSYTKEPVQTRFGWHVIKLNDIRKVKPPSFDEVKDRLKTQYQRTEFEKYAQNLRQKAKIEIKY